LSHQTSGEIQDHVQQGIRLHFAQNFILSRNYFRECLFSRSPSHKAEHQPTNGLIRSPLSATFFLLKRSSIFITILADTHGLERELTVPNSDLLIHAGNWTTQTTSCDPTRFFNRWLGEARFGDSDDAADWERQAALCGGRQLESAWQRKRAACRRSNVTANSCGCEGLQRHEFARSSHLNEALQLRAIALHHNGCMLLNILLFQGMPIVRLGKPWGHV